MNPADFLTVHGDFESYYGPGCSLTTLNYTDYVNHSEFMLWGGAFKLPGWAQSRFFTEPELPDLFATIDWSRTRFVAHNALFDGYILHRKFNIHPAMYGCTLAMSRVIHQGSIDNDIQTLANHYGLRPKRVPTLKATRGKRRLTPKQWDDLALYCTEDTDNCADLDALFSPQLPLEEHELLHMHLRMFCRPRLHIHKGLARLARRNEAREKRKLIEATGVSKEQLSKDEPFAQLLRDAGVEPPTKKGKRETIYAFAKTDLPFQALAKHPDERVRNLVTARAAVQSTLMESRAQRFINCADQGEFPVAYNYGAAHTWRSGGTNKSNPQNLPRGSLLRLSIYGPDDCYLVIGDSGQIEARVLAWLAQHWQLLSDFRNNVDVYCKLASQIFGRTITKADELERHMGKCARLGLGFQMGAKTFWERLDNGSLGGKPVKVSLEFCQKAVDIFRSEPFIPALWKRAEQWLWYMCFGDENTPLEYMGLKVYGKQGRIDLPGGTWLLFPNLRFDEYEQGYVYFADGRTHYIYGGKLIENIVQAIARNIVMRQTQTVDKRYQVVMTTHDELGALVPKHQVEEGVQFIQTVMTTPPSWAPQLPLATEIKYAEYYCK